MLGQALQLAQDLWPNGESNAMPTQGRRLRRKRRAHSHHRLHHQTISRPHRCLKQRCPFRPFWGSEKLTLLPWRHQRLPAVPAATRTAAIVPRQDRWRRWLSHLALALRP